MSDNKYDKLFIKEPIVQGKFAPRMVFYSEEHIGDKPLSVLWSCVTEPYLMVETPHSHDFDQFLHFYGGNSRDITDFDAEVEISLGKEGEKHVITKTTVLHIPAGLIHCPLNFKVINKPIIFMNVALTPRYHK